MVFIYFYKMLTLWSRKGHSEVEKVILEHVKVVEYGNASIV